MMGSRKSDTLRDLLPYVQIKKNMENTHGGVTFFHGCFSRFETVQMVPNCTKRLM